MFGAELRILDGYGCAQCQRGPTDGACCSEPIRYWKRETDMGTVLLFASWPTDLVPYWCERHGTASDSKRCWVCLFGPQIVTPMLGGMPEVIGRKDADMLKEKGCKTCRHFATDGQCCPNPILYYRDPRWSRPDVQLADYPTPRCPYWCADHGVAAIEPGSCPWCERGAAPRKVAKKPPPEPGTFKPMGETYPYTVEQDEDGGGSVEGDDCSPPVTNYSRPGNRTGQTEEKADMASKKKAKKSSPKTHAAKKPTAPAKRDKGPKDRTGMVQEDIDEPTLKRFSKELAHETVELEKLVDKKKHTVSMMNDDIRSKEAVVSELAEQVDTGKRWVSAQSSIPGTEEAAE